LACRGLGLSVRSSVLLVKKLGLAGATVES
jgi:hypothetical protein